MSSSIVPETDAALLARHAVDAAERDRLLARLHADATVLSLHAAGTAVGARVAALDVATGRLALEPETPDEAAASALRGLARAGRATAVATADGVKLQFELASIEASGRQPRMRAALAGPIARLQRRDAFRVAPPADGLARLWIPGADGTSREVEVLDLSVLGVSFRMPGDGPAPPASIEGARLGLPASAPIPCALRVRTLERDGSGAWRAGCELAGLEPSTARAVAVWVHDAQTRRRRLRPRLA